MKLSLQSDGNSNTTSAAVDQLLSVLLLGLCLVLPSSLVAQRFELSAPENFTTSPGNEKVFLEWNVVAGNDGYQINVLRAGSTVKVHYVNEGVTSTTVDGLSNGTAYSFIIRALPGGDWSDSEIEIPADGQGNIGAITIISPQEQVLKVGQSFDFIVTTPEDMNPDGVRFYLRHPDDGALELLRNDRTNGTWHTGNRSIMDSGSYELFAQAYYDDPERIAGSASAIIQIDEQDSCDPDERIDCVPGQFENTFSAPDIENYKTVRVSDFVLQREGNPGYCVGKIYRYHAPSSNSDLFIDLTGQTLVYPLHISGGRNIVIRGGLFDMVVQQGCEAGTIVTKSDKPKTRVTANYPLIPYEAALGISNSEVAWIEGAHFKLNGIQADVIKDISNGQHNQRDRSVYIVNSRAEGMEGMPELVHGDLYQNQSAPVFGLFIENVTVLSSYEGVVQNKGIQNNVFDNSKVVSVRNYYYDLDPVYGCNDPIDRRIGASVISDALSPLYFNVRYRNPACNDLNGEPGKAGAMDARVSVNTAYFYDPLDIGSGDSRRVPHHGFHRIRSTVDAPIARYDFAPASRVGLNYVN